MRKYACLAITTVICFAGCSRQAPTQPQDVDGLVKLLGADDAATRQKTLGALAALPPDKFSELESNWDAPLSADASQSLHTLIQRQRPIITARLRVWTNAQQRYQTYATTIRDQYEQFGQHSAKWDDVARQFLQAITTDPRSSSERDDLTATVQHDLSQLRQSGCSDPFILYMIAHYDGQKAATDSDRANTIREYQAAVPALEQSNYPVVRKCFAHARYLEFALGGKLNGFYQDWKGELSPELDLAMKEWPQALSESALSNWEANELAEVLAYSWWQLSWDGKKFGDRGQVYGVLVPPWQNARPTDDGPLLFTGKLYLTYAWDARGGGYANTVAPQQWQLVRDRIKIARSALEKAWAMDPTDPRVPTEMIDVITGQQTDRADMEQWFQRAMQTNPDNIEACRAKLTYLEPKWYGSPEDMISFGRQCRDGGNFEGRIPFVLAEAYYRLSAYYQKPTDLYQSPGVWDDVRSVYESELALYPDSIYDRSYFAYYAFMCGQMEVAREQFKILGDHPLLEPFGSKQKYDEMVKQAGQ